MDWAIILAGGAGTRFWPLSSPSQPKQLLALVGDRSTAVETVARLEGLIPRERILVVTGAALADPLRLHLGLPAANILVEPRAASTGPALAWGSHEALRRDPEATVLAVHADWHVPDPAPFRAAAAEALALAAAEPVLVTVGVKPSRVETGYGYLIRGLPLPNGGTRVERFVEKPDARTAAALLAAGALWNSGLFAWRARTLLDELSRYTPEIAPALPHLDAGHPVAFFAQVTPVSIDVGLLERSPSVAMVPGDFAWDDIGTWEAVRRVRPLDANGNVVVGPAAVVDVHDSVVWSDGTPVVASGVRDVIIVAANGRILVLDRARAADLKITLDQLPPTIRDLPA